MMRWAAGVAACCLTLHAGEPVVVTGRAMGTTWSARFLPAAGAPEPGRLRAQLAERLERLEQIFSTYRPNSAVSRFNAARNTDWQVVERELVDVLRGCAAVSELTGGAFDATVAPLIARWGFGASGVPAQPPMTEELSDIRSHVGWRKIALRDEPPALRKEDPEVAVDVSSLAKGYAVDEMSALLRALGAPNHLVQLAGDMRAAGEGTDGKGWPVGVENPGTGAAAVSAVVRLVNSGALSTSGNYRNVVVLGGAEVGHIIDPRTGRPVAAHTLAVSVVEPTCAKSSALATGLFVMGVEEGLRLAEERQLAVCFFVRERDGVVRRTSREFAKWEKE